MAVDGRVASGSVEVLSSQNGGIIGQFETVEVVVEGCVATAVGTPTYEQYSLSVAFQMQDGSCGLSRAAIIGIAVGAAVAGVLVAVVLVLSIKFAMATYTCDANTRIRQEHAQDLAQPLLQKY